MIQVGSQIGSYKILKLLGEGGMGRVFIAEHVRLGRKVALKVLLPAFSEKQDLVTRFFNEARAVNKIGHENIVECTDDGTAESGEAFFVMELLSGEPLSTRLKSEGKLSLERALHICIQIGDALAASHAQGIVHRDLKPDNIFLINRAGDPDYVKLLDFGIAKLLGEESGTQAKTRTGALMGTPYYMSPEQCLGKQSEIDHRTDIYALGVLLYELMAGEVPFKGEGFGEVLVGHLSAPFPSVRAKTPSVPEALEQVIYKAAAKDRNTRYITMVEFRDALSNQFPGGYQGAVVRMTASIAASGTSGPRRAVTSLPGTAVGAEVAMMSTLAHGAGTPAAGGAPPGTQVPSGTAVGAAAPAPASMAGEVMSSGAPARPKSKLPLIVAGVAVLVAAAILVVALVLPKGSPPVARQPPPVAPVAARPPAARPPAARPPVARPAARPPAVKPVVKRPATKPAATDDDGWSKGGGARPAPPRTR